MSSAGEHSHFDTSSPTRYAASLRVAVVNITANFLLTTAQVIIGIFGHSQALVADGLHTLSDTLADLLVIFALFIVQNTFEQEVTPWLAGLGLAGSALHRSQNRLQ